MVGTTTPWSPGLCESHRDTARSRVVPEESLTSVTGSVRPTVLDGLLLPCADPATAPETTAGRAEWTPDTIGEDVR